VLTHGSHLTSLCCRCISFSDSAAAAPVCNLKSWSLGHLDDVRAFLNVPLHAVESLSMTAAFDGPWNRFTLPGKHLWLPAQAAGVRQPQLPSFTLPGSCQPSIVPSMACI
jgi:hypothetical protein